MSKVFLDPGHGGSDGGAAANGIAEKDITLDIALRTRKVLLDRYQGVEVRLSRTVDTFVSLGARAAASNAWGADVFVSIHCNAGGGTGFESYVWNGGVSAATRNAQAYLHAVIVKDTGWRDRGRKQANFSVLRNARAPAVLTENGFVDTRADADQLRQAGFRQKVAEAHAYGIAQHLKLKPKTAPKPPPPQEDPMAHLSDEAQKFYEAQYQAQKGYDVRPTSHLWVLVFYRQLRDLLGKIAPGLFPKP